MCICVQMCMHHACLHAITCRGQGTVWESHFFSSTVWVLGIELKSSGLVASLTLWAISPSLFCFGRGGWASTQAWYLLGKCSATEPHSGGVSRLWRENSRSHAKLMLSHCTAPPASVCFLYFSHMQHVWKLFRMVEWKLEYFRSELHFNKYTG